MKREIVPGTFIMMGGMDATTIKPILLILSIRGYSVSYIYVQHRIERFIGHVFDSQIDILALYQVLTLDYLSSIEGWTWL